MTDEQYRLCEREEGIIPLTESALTGEFPRVLAESENYKVEYTPLQLWDGWRVWIIYEKEGREHSLYQDISAEMFALVADPMDLLREAARHLYWQAFERKEYLTLDLDTGKFVPGERAKSQ